mmetsp:Transcript_25746/g.45238  ORF Transcript_25746/g.45238 Transcript_25746/m.45238 type:complete len:346 (-) Transcript_25746:4963-6000(-)
MQKLTNHVQHYAWGHLGSSSIVSKFVKSVQEDKPYAELWLGTHPTLESHIGEEPLSKHVGSLSYLFKVLSVNLPLSIQVHPNSEQAARLNEIRPDIYVDPLHKVELFFALSEFKLLLGFKTDQEIIQTLANTPELREVVGEFTTLKESLAKLYTDETYTQQCVEAFINRLRVEAPDHYSLELSNHFPRDTGIFFSLFMNYCTFQPGQSILIVPGTPHSYLSGYCLECMSASDNVIRAGLTPKRKDVETLLSLLDYDTRGVPVPLVPEHEGRVLVYRTEYKDFELKVLRAVSTQVITCPAIVLSVSSPVGLTQGDRSLVLGLGESAVLTETTTISVEGECYLCQGV